MKVIDHSMNLLLAVILSMACISPSVASHNRWNGGIGDSDSTFVCNDLVQISLNENCEVDLNADMIVEGYTGDLSLFQLKVLNETGLQIGTQINGSHIGDTLYLIALHLPSGQSCWGRALIEDKWAPVLTCANYAFECYDEPASFPLPTVWDNCGPPPTVTKLAETIDKSDICNTVTITQTFIATDSSGNASNICTQLITTTPPALPLFPKDTTWECSVFNAHPNIILPKPVRTALNATGSGIPDVANGDFCPFNVVHTDLQFTNDCGATFTIVRTWVVINWCTDEIVTMGRNGEDNVQLIRIIDQTPPIVNRPPYEVNANLGGSYNEACASAGYLLPPVFVDDCHEVSVRILTGIGEAIYLGSDGRNGGFIPYPGLPLGLHHILYEATDECGNVDTLHVPVTVADKTAPEVICDQLTTVSLGIEGGTYIPADVLDDGSKDNCCLEGFKARKMSATCSDLDTVFQDSVLVCCADVGDTIQVIMRAYDCHGNTNDCMVRVAVDEKLPPRLESCPGGQVINCEFYHNFLEIPLSEGNDSVLLQFGEPVFQDNCEIVFLEKSFNINLNQCLRGTIIRRWRVTDTSGNGTAACTQNIQVNHYSDWVVEFPADQDVTCGNDLPDTGEPVVFYENCELIAVSNEDEIFTQVPGVCYKIARIWTVINWCVASPVITNTLIESSEQALNVDFNYDNVKSPRVFHDGVNTANFSTQAAQYGAQPDGVVVYQQIILVSDKVAPVVVCLPFLDVCITDTSCVAAVTLPVPTVTDCSTDITVSATGDLGTGLGPFAAVPPGLYDMTYQVEDNCGNKGFCETTIEVRDCKKPTPFCKNGLIIEIDEDSVIIVNAEIFDDGSFDNCPGDLMFSFSIDPTDSLAVFDCSTLNFQTVNVWLTDAAGNQDFCETFVFVQDNNGVCSGIPRIAGRVATAENEWMRNVEMRLENQPAVCMTDAEGRYFFDVPAHADHSVSALRNDNPLNGVTTYDIVLITKHILGVELLDSPYKIIAADANYSNTVTTFDIVTIRKLILQVNTAFPNGLSWRFIDRKCEFPEPMNPFSVVLPQALHFNKLTENVLDADFIGIKVGDVNFSAVVE